MLDLWRFAKKIDDQLLAGTIGYQYAIYVGEELAASGSGGKAVLSPAKPMSPDHKMTLASMSKTLTAAAMLKALEVRNAAGAGLTIDSLVHPFLPNGWLRGPHVHEMTFRHLLKHTSGLRPVADEDLFVSLRQTVANGSTDTNWNKGEYQNCNYSLLRVLVPNVLLNRDAATTMPEGEDPGRYTARMYFNFVRDRVLAPVGLDTRSLAPVLPQEANAYYHYVTKAVYLDPDFDWHLQRVGAGHWFMSAKDLARWIAGLRNGRVLSPASFQQMTSLELGMYRADASVGGPDWNHNGGFENSGAGMEGDWVMLPNGVTAVCMRNSIGGVKKSSYQIIVNAHNSALLAPPVTTTAPAAAGWNGRLHTAIRDGGGFAHINAAVAGQPFRGWMEIEGHAKMPAAPALAGMGARLYACCAGFDQHVYITSAPSGEPFDGWGKGWVALGTQASAHPPAMATLANRLYVVVVEPGNRVFIASAADGGAFGPWQEVQGNGTSNAAPAAAACGNRLYVAVKGIRDGRVHVNSAESGKPFDGFGNGWAAVGSLVTDAAPAIASIGDRIYLFAKSVDDRISVTSATTGQAFGAWAPIEGAFATNVAPAAASLGNRVFVFGVGKADGRLYVNSAVDGQPFDGFGSGWTEVQW
jgi:CubicO group peptidase (beta-lactamase class C family)